MLYAVIESGGKQYKVAEGDIVSLEKLGEEPGASIGFDNVLMLADGENVQVGTPYVADAKVQASVVNNGRGKKITVIKFKRRKNYYRKQGHRQDFTEIRVDKILTTAPKIVKRAEEPKPVEKKVAKAPEKPAIKKEAAAKTTKKTAKPSTAKTETSATKKVSQPSKAKEE